MITLRRYNENQYLVTTTFFIQQDRWIKDELYSQTNTSIEKVIGEIIINKEKVDFSSATNEELKQITISIIYMVSPSSDEEI